MVGVTGCRFARAGTTRIGTGEQISDFFRVYGSFGLSGGQRLVYPFLAGKDLQSPQSWQVAFAAHLAVTAAGQLGFDLAARCCDRGIRVVGIAVITTALLNLAVAWTSMKSGSVLGIAVAAVISQSVLMLSLGWYSCRQMQMSWWRLTLRNWLLGLAVVVLGVMARTPLASNPFYSALISISLYGIALLIVVRVLEISRKDFQEEWETLKGIFRS